MKHYENRNNVTESVPITVKALSDKIDTLKYASQAMKFLTNLPSGRLKEECSAEVLAIIGSIDFIPYREQIKSLTDQLATAESKIAKANLIFDQQRLHQRELGAKDKEIEALKAKILELNTQVQAKKRGLFS